MRTTAQPLDLNPEAEAVLSAFSPGQEFSLREAAKVTGLPVHRAAAVLATLKRNLPHCPEGIQIVVKRGSRGYHRFELGDG